MDRLRPSIETVPDVHLLETDGLFPGNRATLPSSWCLKKKQMLTICTYQYNYERDWPVGLQKCLKSTIQRKEITKSATVTALYQQNNDSPFNSIHHKAIYHLEAHAPVNDKWTIVKAAIMKLRNIQQHMKEL